MREWNSMAVARMAEGAETLLGGLLRTRSFLSSLQGYHPDDAILVVTHSFISRCIWMELNQVSNPQQTYGFRHPNSEIKLYQI